MHSITTSEVPVNSDIIKGKWQQVKGEVKQRWGKLTDNDLKEMEGNLDIAVGKLQERYGTSRDQAEREWNEFCTRVAANRPDATSRPATPSANPNAPREKSQGANP
jgi:uncharacterized protein YjbJ (UPF0337 family)